MTPDSGNDLDSHLDRLMETVYEALGAAGARSGDVARPAGAPPELPERIGPYPVTALLGRGGTSCVYRGTDPVLGRELAIKVIDRRHAPGGALAQRFVDEARICSQLPHPGIVPIYGTGQLDDGRPYITMRLVEGDTFAALLAARTGPQDRTQQFLATFARVCETVAFAHARGVVHGDLKPANVMVGAFGQVQVMDWGFSRLVGPGAPGERARGMGTPAFMAPEQAAGNGAIDARTDVFGLGAILCVILTGAPPFAGGSRSEVHVRAAGGRLGEALARLRVCGADPELTALAMDCLQHAPDARPADAAAVAARVAAWLRALEERAHRLELAAAAAQVEAKEQRRTRWRTVALGLLGVAFAGVYAWTRFERQAHDYEARTAVVQAMERARNLRAGADVAGALRIRWLGEAAQAAQQAKVFASTVGDPALREDAERLSQRLDEDRDAAGRDEAMVEWLDDFPSHLDQTREQLEPEFAGAFRRYGVDVESLPDDDVVARLRGSAIGPAVARALDDWGFLRRAKPDVAAAEWQRFHELALRIDVEPQRTAVRRALLAADRDAMRALADDAAFADAPTDTLDLLAIALAHAGERRAAQRTWQRANARHPDSVRVIHSLAVSYFSETKAPPWEEIVRLFATGTALRPDSAHLWTDLAHGLVGLGDVAGAEAALQRAIELAPRDERALASLADLVRCAGRPAEALARTLASAERSGTAGSWRVLGDGLLVDGFVQEAADAYRRAVALDDTNVNNERVGQCLLELGDLDGAARCLRTAIGRDGARASPHAHLGLVLRQQGRFDEALAALRHSRDLGDAAWAARCDAWLETTERAAAAAAAPAVAAVPGSGDATVERAFAALATGRVLAAAAGYREVLDREPAAIAAEFAGWNADRATQAAVRAAEGAGDAQSLAPEERAVWRAQAVRWLGDAITAVRDAYVAGQRAPAPVRLRLAGWRCSPAFGAVRPDVEPQLAALEAALAAGEPMATVHAPFDDGHRYRLLGTLPGVLAPYGGLAFGADPDELVVAGHAQRNTASLFAVRLRRGDGGHVEGFAAARRLAAAPYADGGIARGPRDVLCYTRYPLAEIGVLQPGGRGPDRVEKLVGASAGGLAFVPPGLPGAGRAKVLTWPGGAWFDVAVTTGADGVELGEQRHRTTLPGGPDGFAFMPARPPLFERPSVLVAEWSAHAIAAYELDGNGDPVVATRRPVLSGCRGVLGLAVDPVTGDVLVSTWRGDGTEQIAILQRSPR